MTRINGASCVGFGKSWHWLGRFRWVPGVPNAKIIRWVESSETTVTQAVIEIDQGAVSLLAEWDDLTLECVTDTPDLAPNSAEHGGGETWFNHKRHRYRSLSHHIVESPCGLQVCALSCSEATPDIDSLGSETIETKVRVLRHKTETRTH